MFIGLLICHEPFFARSSSSECFRIYVCCLHCYSCVFPWLIHSIWVPDPHYHHRQLHRTGPRTASPRHGQDPHVWTPGEHQNSLFSCHSLLIIKVSHVYHIRLFIVYWIRLQPYLSGERNNNDNAFCEKQSKWEITVYLACFSFRPHTRHPRWSLWIDHFTGLVLLGVQKLPLSELPSRATENHPSTPHRSHVSVSLKPCLLGTIDECVHNAASPWSDLNPCRASFDPLPCSYSPARNDSCACWVKMI